MEAFINRKKIIIVFLAMICMASLYFAYKKLKIDKPISAKLVFYTEEYLYETL